MVVLVTTVGCLWLLASCNVQAKTTNNTAPPQLVGTRLDAPVPDSLLSLPLVDQAGQRVTLGSFEGRIVVVSDMTTLCQETCAIVTASLLQAARAVDRAGLAQKIEFLSITIDPARDDTGHLSAYRRLFGGLANWEVLTGSTADIDRLWTRLGIWRHTVPATRPYPRDWLTDQPLTVDIQHSDDLIFIDAGQRFRFEIDGPATAPSANAIPRPLYTFMDQQGRQNVRNPSAGSWTAAQVVGVLHWLVEEGVSP